MASHKLNARGRYLLQAAETQAARAAEVSLFVRGREPFTEQQVHELEEHGARVRTVAGDVLTASAPLDSLDVLTDSDFVVAVEVSEPLYPEEPGTAEPPAGG